MMTGIANIASSLERTAHCWPRQPALAHGARLVCDYAGLADRVARLAAGLRAGGIEAGDRVAVVGRNVPEYIETLYACWWAGAVAMPVNARLHARELAFVLADSGARWAFVDATWEAALAGNSCVPDRVIRFGDAAYRQLLATPSPGRPVAVAAEDAAWLFYTSGTTGRPKGVIITHANLAAMGQCYRSDVEAVAPGDTLLHPAPLSHGSGLYVVPCVQGGGLNVVPESGGFDPAEIAELLRRWDRVSFFAAPTMLKRLVASSALTRDGVARLKCIVVGGAPLYVADSKAAFAVLGPRLAQIYGQGESPMTITAMSRALLADAIARDDVQRLASVGVAQSGIEIRIGSVAECEQPLGAAGEVLVRGPTVMRGYWGNPQATATTLAGGWLHTGDVGRLDADGFLTLLDRSKDLIISGGANIYPREVEEVLLGHAAIVEAAVVGRPHPDWGEEVVAFVVARAGVDRAGLIEELDGRCLAAIARFKRPRHYEFVEELPKNNTGKVRKTALRERLGEREGHPRN